MADLQNTQKQSLYTSTISQAIDGSQTTGIVLADLFGYTVSETTYLTILDPDNPEVISFTGQDGTGELTGVTRGLALSDGGSSSASSHAAGVQVVLSNPWQVYDDIRTAVNAKVDTSGDTMTGLLDFSGSGRVQVPVFADDTARDAAIPSPVSGLIVYNTSGGEFEIYQGGAWVTMASGSTQPNATTTVAGKVELATEAEANAGTVTGGTGASLVVTPDLIARIQQNNPHIYNDSAGSADAYTLDLTPNVSSLVEGQIFVFKANFTNTGAATLNVDGTGATSMKKRLGEDLEAGNIQSGDIYMVIYDGTNFVVLNATLVPNKGDIIVGKGSGDVGVLPAGSDGDIIKYNSSTATGLETGGASGSLDVDHTAVNITGGTEQNIYQYSLPANTLGVGAGVKFKAIINDLDLGSGDTFTVRLKLGSTTLATIVYDLPVANQYGDIDVILIANGSTSSQKGVLQGSRTTGGNFELYQDEGTSSEDATTSLNFTVTGEHSNGGNTADFYLFVLELI